MTIKDQLKNISDTMSGYFTAVSTNLDTPASPTPSFEDVVSLLEYDELLVAAIEGVNRAANYATGGLTDIVHQVIAVNREFDMRAKSPAQYIEDGAVDAGTDSSVYNDIYGRYYNYLRGTSPEQGQG